MFLSILVGCGSVDPVKPDAEITMPIDAAIDSALDDGPGCVCTDDGNPCTDQACEGLDCKVTNKPEQTPCPGGLCYGGSCCTGCWDGQNCLLGTAPGVCGHAGAACADCDDHNECTDDVCVAGTCGNNAHTGMCNAGHGTCVSSNCVCGGTGQPCCQSPQPSCTDGSGCNAATGTCGNCGTVGQPCCGSTCTVGVCSAGMCRACGGTGEPCCAPSICNSGNVCLNMQCQACGGTGQPCCASSACTDDANACDGSEVCQNGTCRHSGPLNCADTNPCTDDSCDPAIGCVHAANTLPCDDGNACTTGEHCSNRTCGGGTPLDCSGTNPCIAYSCDPVQACRQNPVANGTPCGRGVCENSVCTAKDIWAVGELGAGLQRFVAHWNGSMWSQIYNPGFGAVAVGGSGANDVWAVGGGSIAKHWTNGFSFQPLTESITAADDPADYAYYAAWGINASDDWAVGQDANAGNSGLAIAHWDGTQFSARLVLPGNGRLLGVWGSGPNDVWAVGALFDTTQGVALHFTGGASSTPQVFTFDNAHLSAIWGSASNDVWVVGQSASFGVAMHWNGSQWTSLSPVQNTFSVNSVWGLRSDDVWVTGVDTTGRGIAIHFATAWPASGGLPAGTSFPVPANSPNAVWASVPNEAWIGGTSTVNGDNPSVIHWDGAVWTNVFEFQGGNDDQMSALWGPP